MPNRSSNRSSNCEIPVDDLLGGRLAPLELVRVEAHLETCAACRERLDSTAADRRYWTEAAAYLRDDRFDADASRLFVADVSRHEADEDRPEATRIADYFDATDDPIRLGRFGGYEVAGIVGSGGMGVVLKGYDTALDRYVAIKTLAPHLATSGAARTRFAREAKAAAAVLHENVVAIHRVAEANGLPYLVMPYLAGESLQRRLDERGPLTLVEVLRIGMQVAAGLAAAHAQGLVHRDVKPGNVLLDHGVERVVLTDFGLARAADDASLTRSGVIAGTPQYMSPEQARGEPVDGRSDLFSLGSLLYAMVGGRPPFRAETAFGVLRRITDAEPHPLRDLAPQTPEWLAAIVARLHAKAPQDRFGSAAEVADLLGRWLAHVQQPAAVPPPPGAPTGRRAIDGRIIVAAGTGFMVLLTLATPTLFRIWAGLADRPSLSSPADVGEETPSTGALPEPAAAPIAESELLAAYGDIRRRAAGLEKAWSDGADDESPAYDSDAVRRAAMQALKDQLEDLSRRVERGDP